MTSFVFDARDRKLQQTDRLSGITTWAYDGNSNLLTMLDPDNHSAGKTTAWAYNARNQKVSETYPRQRPGASPPVHDVKAFDYDPIGRPGTVTNQNGETIAPAFDFADRLTSRAYTVSGGTTASFTDAFIYDNAGRLLSAASPQYNNTVAFTYANGHGRKTSEALTIGGVTYTTSIAYNAAGNRTGISVIPTTPDSRPTRR